MTAMMLNSGSAHQWPVKRLRFSMVSNPVRSEVRHWRGEEFVSFVPMDAVGEFGEFDASQERAIADVYAGYTYFAEGDVVVAKITPCFENGKGAIARNLCNGVGFGTTEFHVLRAEPGISNRWLYYLTASEPFRRIGASEMLGAGGQKRVPETFIKDFRVGVPKLDEQERIADYLDWKTVQIDALIAKKRKLIERLKEQRLAVITQAITKGLDSNAPLRESHVSWLGMFPSHWEVVPLGFLVMMSGGLTPSMANPAYWDGDTPWVTPKDMKVSWISDSIDHVSKEALMETSLPLYPSGTVLVVVRGMILAHSFPVAIAALPVTVNQDMKALRCGERLEPEYLFWCLTGLSKVLSGMAQESAHGTRKIESDTLKKFILPVPPIPEQLAIVESLRVRLQQIDRFQEAAERTINLQAEYRSALITAAVLGTANIGDVPVGAL